MLPAALIITASLLQASSPAASDGDWPGWRGVGAAAIGKGSPPVEWSEEKNIRWKMPIPGKGLSSPIVLDGVIYLTTAVPTNKKVAPEKKPEPAQEGGGTRGGSRGGRGGRGGFMSSTPPAEHDFLVLAIAHDTGEILWEKKATTLTPHQGTHGDGSFASQTPVTDGERLFVSFGSVGIFAYDFDGELLWEKDLGNMSIMNSFGEGTSPVIAGGNLVINWAHNGDSFLVALDAATGEEVWRQERQRGTGWSTPNVVKTAAGELVIIGGATTQAYDAKSGALVWFHGGDGKPVEEPEEPAGGAGGGGRFGSRGGSRGGGGGGGIASPVVAGDHIFLSTSSRRGSMLALAIESSAAGEGDKDERVTWTHAGDTPNIPSPIVVDGLLYTLRGNSGILTAIDVASGDVLYAGERLSGMTDAYASPVSANGYLYFTGRDGTFEVVETGPAFESVAVNSLDDRFDASPAIVGDTLLLRGMKNLYCIGTDDE